MKQRKTPFFAGILTVLVLLLTGCASRQISLDQKIQATGAADLPTEVKMPPSYNMEYFDKLTMNVFLEDVDGKPHLPPNLVEKLQGNIARMKRFKVASIYNNGARRSAEDLADVGDVEVTSSDTPKLTLGLSLKMFWSKEYQFMGKGKWAILYSVSGEASCENYKTKTVEYSKSIKGEAKETQFRAMNGSIMGGFDDTVRDSEENMILTAARRALVNLMNDLGKLYPVGGKITKCDPYGESLTFAKGKDEGIGDNQMMTVFVKEDDDAVYPLCYAEATPGKTGGSSLSPIRWCDSDKKNNKRYSVDLCLEFKKDPRAFLKNHDVWAVGWGISEPDLADDGTNKEMEHHREN